MLKNSFKLYNNGFYRLRRSCNCNKSSIVVVVGGGSTITATTSDSSITKRTFSTTTRTDSIPKVQPLAKPQKSKWKSVVGLEIHAQIDTKSKLFSGAGINFNSTVNSCVSLFDAAIPGTLPVLNRNCVMAAVKTAIALSCRINAQSMFDRKHYFYADLPAGYQITQQRAALANDGELIFPVFVPGIHKKPYNKRVRLHQLQLEQDSGKSLHDLDNKKSLVDLNRAGIPLMELVFDPDLTDGEEAAALVKELILIFKRLKTCSCKMEEGALRIDANVSIHREGEPFGVRTEIKNIGSVRGVAQAITYEIQRQRDIMEEGGGGDDGGGGGVIQNETRSWDAIRKCTIAMRDKEVQQDYRFMPEPNLPPLHLHITGDGNSYDRTASHKNLNIINVNEIIIPELPEMTRRNLINKFGLTEEIAIILVREDILMQYFLAIIDKNPKIQPKTITNLLINDLLTMCHKHKIEIEDCKILPIQMVELIEMLECEEIHLKMARLIIQEILLKANNHQDNDNNNEKFPSPKEIAHANNWKQICDKNEIEKLCRMVIERNPKIVNGYQNGKIKLLFALAGECARETDDKANMAMVVNKLKELLRK